MQALWSRAAQTRSSCRCSACFHATSGLARRATTGASRRRAYIGDLFTACYSTVLGTALFVDTKVKEERRKQWERAIAEAKGEIPHSALESKKQAVPLQDQVEGVPQLYNPVADNIQQNLCTPNATYRDLSLSKYEVSCQPALDLHLEDFQEISPKDTEFLWSSESEENWADDTVELNPSFAPRDPVTRLHVDKMEGMVSRLVTRLLIRSDEMGKTTLPATNAEVSRHMKEISSRLLSLQDDDTRLPSYTFHNQEEAWKTQSQLNGAIEALLRQTTVEAPNVNVNVIMAKICYNLLVSSSPPNIETYNILIRHLDKSKLHSLARVVVDSFLFESKYTPTSATIQLLLNHHSMQKDAIGFRGIVNRMRAANGDMRIKKRTLDSLIKPKEQEWASTRKVMAKGGYLIEKVTRDTGIFEALINGFLDLYQLRSAVRSLRAALRESVQVSSETFYRVVESCARVLDCEAGRSILRAVLGQQEEGRNSTIEYCSKTRFAIRRLFCLCGIESSLDQRRSLLPKASAAAVLDLQHRIAILSLEQKVLESSRRIADLANILARAAEAHEGSRLTFIREAFSVLYKASSLERVRSLKLKTLDQAVMALQSALVGDPMEWHDIQYKKLSLQWRQRYDVLITQYRGFSWTDRLEILSIYQQKGVVPRHHRLYWKIQSAKMSGMMLESRRIANLTDAREMMPMKEPTIPQGSPAITGGPAVASEDDYKVQKKRRVALQSSTEDGPRSQRDMKMPLRLAEKRAPRVVASQHLNRNLTFPRAPSTLGVGLPLPLHHHGSGIEASAG